MVHHKTIWAFLIPAVIVLTLYIEGERSMNPRNYPMQIPDFQARDLVAIDSATNTLIQSYRDMTNDLVKQLRDGNLPADKKVYVIYLLGQLRAASAVTILIEHIDLKAVKMDPDAIGRWGPYPAEEALVMIGTPAVNMILDKLPDEQNELRRQLMCDVISDAVGKRAGEAMLRSRSDEEPNPARRAHLESALQVFRERH